ncbi:ATP-binding protein [Pedobacter sp. JCM 36344]|uniref:ATP-binding protein n=1 Tax=Pedobacter sp. JCM 36344 TaxID=3374280 RepID=UPI00397BDF00
MDTVKNLDDLLLTNTFDIDHFVQLSPEMICIAGYDGFFKKINPAVSKTLGYTQQELLARPINEFVYFEDQTTTIESREAVKRSIPLINFENRYVTKSGEIVWLSWTSIGIEEKQLVFGIAKNITHKKRLEEDRNLLLTSLTATNNELKKLAYTAAHDLRSPVDNLISIFSIIEDTKVENDEIVLLLDLLKQSSENLRETLNNYVDILIQKKSLNIQLGPVSFSESLRNIERSLKSLILDTKTEIFADFTSVDAITFNKTYIESIFLNLVSNSIKYAKPNTYPQISLESKKLDGNVTLKFKDNGIGFDMEKVKGRVFGFNQTFHDNIDSKGIGLYLVNSHLTSLGGHIEMESRVNEGTTFTITFKA